MGTEQVVELSKKLQSILDNVLATGDWESSLFLKTAATKLRKLRDQVGQLGRDQTTSAAIMVKQDTTRKGPPTDYSQVFILLYQVDGANLDGWLRTVKTLYDYNTTRPVYKDEKHVREFIRSKTTNTDRHGYAVVNIKNENFYVTEQQADQFGNPLFTLKEDAIKPENVVEFVHNNSKRYAIHDQGLVFLDAC